MIVTEKEFMLNIGGKYLVKIADEQDTIGIFKGYFALGGDTAIVMEMADEKIRFIPVGQIIYIDVLEATPKEECPEPKSRDIYYG